jgi:hypothetical protein
MIDSQRLLQDSKKLLKVLEQDVRGRLDENSQLDAQLKSEWEAARAAKRTAGAYLDWRDENITQSAVHWILACVFLRFLEDNDFLPRAYLTSADKEAREVARDDYERYFRANPNHSDLEYLLHAFRAVAHLPGLKGLYDEQHNPLYRLPLSGDGGIALLGFWRKLDPDSGLLIHNFTDRNRQTRFLGDLYQDLSESARQRYALLQTPEFVEEFILDRTLNPAISTFGYKDVRLIDPTCGSGHFLLGAFRRLFDLWAKNEPARNLPDLAQQALNGVYGVDINPFAVEIARFRLLIAALAASDIGKLKDAPDFKIHLATGDSLLHGPRFGLRGTQGMFEDKRSYAGTGLAHAYQSEDLPELQRILGQQYHAVVGNPPYIVVRDAARNEAYRARYVSCHRQYSLGVPFTERFFDLALAGDANDGDAGFVGQITANSFMKREFGKKLVEEFLPSVDLTHVIDTSGAYIPGHGTPTVILFGRHRASMGEVVRTVMGIKGEPITPEDPANGKVWTAIVDQIDRVGSESDFLSVADSLRAPFAKHPWAIGGGGAAELRDRIEENRTTLSGCGAEVGYHVITGEDACLILAHQEAVRRGLSHFRPIAEGDAVRDWLCQSNVSVLWPYDPTGGDVSAGSLTRHLAFLWPYRSSLRNRKLFGSPIEARGLRWWDLREVYRSRLTSPFIIAFGEVATHNHFVLDHGGKVFKQTAPVIKLKEGASEAEHLGLLGLLNSSVACFWLKQVCTPKGGDHVGQEGARVRKTLWDERYAFNSTNVAEFPLAAEHPNDLTARLDSLARELASCMPTAVLATGVPHRFVLDEARIRHAALRAKMIALQEELDWRSYRSYGLMQEELKHSDPPGLSLGERPFEIVLARRMAAGIEQSTWFERHGSTPITDLPSHWPADYQAIVERRIALIESDRNIGLIERPEYKRRWNTESWEEQEQRALREWLLDRLESETYWPRSGTLQLRTVFQLSDVARRDADFMQVGALYTGRDDFDVSALIAELTESESVPYLSALRYTDEGLRKREAWEETWALQRREDDIDARVAAEHPRKPDESDEDYRKRLAPLQREARLKELGEVPVPPKYKSSDFKSATYWRLCGALDVPKERFVSFPAATPDADGTMLLGWAGWDHLQQATALAGHYLHLKDNEGWPTERLVPLLAGLLELVPWLKQWHNDWNPEHDARMGDYFEGFVQDDARALETTVEALQKWRPAAAVRRKRKK